MLEAVFRSAFRVAQIEILRATIPSAKTSSLLQSRTLKSAVPHTLQFYVDNGGTTFDTTAGSTYLSTDPYWSGWNDDVLGTDGSKYNYTNGKEPGMLQKIEFMNGSYFNH